MIEHYFSLQTVHAYLGMEELNRISFENGIKVQHIPIDLDVLNGVNSIAPISDPAGPNLSADGQEQVLEWVQDYNIQLNPRYLELDHGPTHFSHMVLLALDAIGIPIGGYLPRFMSAKWGDGTDLADAKKVIDLLNLDYAQIELVLELAVTDQVRQSYIENTQRAVKYNVTTSPTYIVQGERFSGFSSIEQVEKACELAFSGLGTRSHDRLH